MASRQERRVAMNERREAMSVLAAASSQELLDLWCAAGLPEDAKPLRGPETGLVVLRGRMGGGGAPFNFGEATVTRATVSLPCGVIGHAYALGRDKKKVRIAAILDGLRQKPEHAQAVEEKILSPLRQARLRADEKRRAETAATRVDFFTMVRGED